MSTRIVLDAAIGNGGERVLVERDSAGGVRSARFDLSGLPRVDSLLTGRPVAEVPALVERLCGVCPVAHHVAGIQALEVLYDVESIPPGAQLMRRLLHHASVLEVHALRFLIAGSDAAMVLRRVAKLGLAAAGSLSHFPATAVVGGVAAPPKANDLARCAEALPDALAAALRLAETTSTAPSSTDPFTGADVALVDDDGHPDLLGPHLTAVAADGAVLVDRANAAEWSELVAESEPGSPAPRPYLRAAGPVRGWYRVGPLAQLRVGPLATARAAELQVRWREGGAVGATPARAIMVIHTIEVMAQVLAELTAALSVGTVEKGGVSVGTVEKGGVSVGTVEKGGVSSGTAGNGSGFWRLGGGASSGGGVGTGWVDGARGLLVHRYEATGEGKVRAAIVLTPTAQNEGWLADLLTRALVGVPDGEVRVDREVEDAIREADPCLPCAAAPPGQMGLVLETVAAGTVSGGTVSGGTASAGTVAGGAGVG